MWFSCFWVVYVVCWFSGAVRLLCCGYDIDSCGSRLLCGVCWFDLPGVGWWCWSVLVCGFRIGFLCWQVGFLVLFKLWVVFLLLGVCCGFGLELLVVSFSLVCGLL